MNYTAQKRIALIMSGGSGERFWPLSRHNRPKQLLYLGSKIHTLLEQAVINISPLIPPERIYFATSEHLAEIIIKTQMNIPRENVFSEPLKRNTTGCLVFAAANLLARYGGDGSDITMAVLPADHRIGNPALFRASAEVAMTAAENENTLVTLAMQPDRPETGYGYIEIEPHPLSTLESKEAISVFPVKHFYEKPARKSAENYLASGRFFWNSGMFFWRLSTFIEELKLAMPEMVVALRSIVKALGSDDNTRIREVFEDIEDISIDCALMEKAKRILAVRCDFGWDDIGAWDALDRTFSRDDNGNVAVGEPILIDSSNCIVYNETGAEKMTVATLGIEGLVVIVCDDGVLVLPKDRTQDVRMVVSELKKRNPSQE